MMGDEPVTMGSWTATAVGVPTTKVRQGDEAGESLRASDGRLLHVIDRVASNWTVAVVVVIADVVWVAASLVLHFPTRLETIFQTIVAALTLAMVFVIQHTQNREQVATQRKLDEILRALPQADNTLIAFEEASDAQLARARQHHRGLRSAALNPDPADRRSSPPPSTDDGVGGQV